MLIMVQIWQLGGCTGNEKTLMNLGHCNYNNLDYNCYVILISFHRFVIVINVSFIW